MGKVEKDFGFYDRNYLRSIAVDGTLIGSKTMGVSRVLGWSKGVTGLRLSIMLKDLETESLEYLRSIESKVKEGEDVWATVYYVDVSVTGLEKIRVKDIEVDDGSVYINKTDFILRHPEEIGDILSGKIKGVPEDTMVQKSINLRD